MAPASATASKARASLQAGGLKPVQAAAVLAEGGLVILPTETVWGLGSGLESRAKLFSLKGRDTSKPAALAFSGGAAAQSSGLVRWSAEAQRLAERFWPGPLTLILPAVPGNLAGGLIGGEGGVGIRIPDCPETLEVLRLFARPLVLTSANRSGEPPPSGPFPRDLFPDLPRLETSCLPGTVASTVVSLAGRQPRVLREGLISSLVVLECLGL